MSVEQKYFKVADVAKHTGLNPVTVRNFCHARGQRFASRVGKNGHWMIDIKKFEDYIERNRDYIGGIR